MIKSKIDNIVQGLWDYASEYFENAYYDSKSFKQFNEELSQDEGFIERLENYYDITDKKDINIIITALYKFVQEIDKDVHKRNENKMDLQEATIKALIEEAETTRKITRMDKEILTKLKELNIDVPEDIALKIIDDFRKKTKDAYFKPYKITIPKYITNVIPNFNDYSLSSVLAHPEVIKIIYDRDYNKVQ